ncbi:MAG: hypothetical protein U0441_11030 [Polyangiaceae bacterium]
MAVEKSSTKPKRKTAKPADDKGAVPAPEKSAAPEGKPTKRGEGKSAKAASEKQLRQMSDPRFERRYEPATSAFAIGTVLVFSLGAVALGAGVYAQWLRSGDAGPHPYSLYFLVTGAVLLLAVALFGQTTARAIRVGDGGVAIERDEGVDRVLWCDVSRLLVSSDAVTVQGGGTTISVPRNVHAQAAARILREASERIPDKLDDKDAKIEAPAGPEPEKIPLDPPQIAGRACKGSGKVLSFEKDARFCGRCGEVYHKTAVPDRCLTCDARLK